MAAVFRSCHLDRTCLSVTDTFASKWVCSRSPRKFGVKRERGLIPLPAVRLRSAPHQNFLPTPTYQFNRRVARISRQRLLTTCSLATYGTGVWVTLSACAAAGQVLQERTAWGARLSAPVLAMTSGMALSSLGVLPASCAAYDTVWAVLMPMAVALSLLEHDLGSLFSSSGSALAGFAFASLATIAGTFAAWGLCGRCLGPDGFKIAACLCSSYIGGTLNFAATSQAMGMSSSSSLLAAAVAIDNFAMVAYLSVLMAMPADMLERSYGKGGADQPAPTIGAGGGASTPGKPGETSGEPPVTTESLVVSGATAVGVCWVGSALATTNPALFAAGSHCQLARGGARRMARRQFHRCPAVGVNHLQRSHRRPWHRGGHGPGAQVAPPASTGYADGMHRLCYWDSCWLSGRPMPSAYLISLQLLPVGVANLHFKPCR
eukprot:jgi/Mesvir1/19787/Mv13082-RA.1